MDWDDVPTGETERKKYFRKNAAVNITLWVIAIIVHIIGAVSRR